MRLLESCLAFSAAALAAPEAVAQPLVLVNHRRLRRRRDPSARSSRAGRARSSAPAQCGRPRAARGSRPASPGPRATVARWRDWVYWTVDFSSLGARGRRSAWPAVPPQGDVSLVARSACEKGRPRAPHAVRRPLLLQGPARLGPPRPGRPRGAARRTGRQHAWTPTAAGTTRPATTASTCRTSRSPRISTPSRLPSPPGDCSRRYDLLQRRAASALRQYLRRLLDEGAWGADYLVRVQAPGGSFYRSVSAPGTGEASRRSAHRKDASVRAARRRSSSMRAHAARGRPYQSSFRAGGGRGHRRPGPGGGCSRRRASAQADYLRAAEEAWALPRDEQPAVHERRAGEHRRRLLRAARGHASSSSPRASPATRRPPTRGRRASCARLSPPPRAYWRADDKERPFFHAADAGLPVVSLIAYLDIADEARRRPRSVTPCARPWSGSSRSRRRWRTRSATRGSSCRPRRACARPASSSRTTPTPRPGGRARTRAWASLAFAARAWPFRTSPTIAAFAGRLRRYAQDQLDWILGRNPFDASMLRRAPGATTPNTCSSAPSSTRTRRAGSSTASPPASRDAARHRLQPAAHRDRRVTTTGAGASSGCRTPPGTCWRWRRARAVTSRGRPRDHRLRVRAGSRCSIPPSIAAEKLTHINYAFANIKDGLRGRGLRERRRENYRCSRACARAIPNLKILVSVGGWTWSGGFSDVALTPREPAKFVESAVEFVRRHDLDGFDVDWEYPGPARRRQRPSSRGQAELHGRSWRSCARPSTRTVRRVAVGFSSRFAAGALARLPRAHRDGRGPGCPWTS